MQSVVDGRPVSRHGSERSVSRFNCSTRLRLLTLSPFFSPSSRLLTLVIAPWFGFDQDHGTMRPRQGGYGEMPFHWLVRFSRAESTRRTRKGKEIFPLDVPHLVAAPDDNCDITWRDNANVAVIIVVGRGAVNRPVKMPARFSKFSYDGPCIDFVHPWTDSCISATVGLGLHSLQESLRIYTTVYIVRATRLRQSILLFLFVSTTGYPSWQRLLETSVWAAGGAFFRRHPFSGQVHWHSVGQCACTQPVLRDLRTRGFVRCECTTDFGTNAPTSA